MSGTPVKIGPFLNGLNTLNEPTTVADTECVELTNFDIDLDGSVVNRPSVSTITTGVAGGYHYLGTFTHTNGTIYFIYQTGTSAKAYDVAGNTWTTINSNIIVNNCLQYLNKLWLVADLASATSGGYWDPSGGFNAVASMPKGIFGCIYKERLFIATGVSSTNPSRINFSGAANFSSWNTGTDFFDVANGDGQAIIRIHSWNNQIAIFKQNSTYTFGYDSAPTKGVTQLQSSTIGIASSWALAEYEGNLYILWGNYLYSIINWNWDQLNTKVPFSYYSYKTKTSWTDFTLSIINNRLVVRFYDNFYVYGLKTRAFSLWRYNESSYTPSIFIRYPLLDPTSGQTFFIAANYDKASSYLYKLVDTVYSNTAVESFTCSIVTKTYDFNVPYTFKRLFHWGVDLLSKSTINFYVIPTVYSIPITWGYLKSNGIKWSQLKTWARPLDFSINVSDSTSSANPSGVRTYIKLIKSLRFRQIAFKLTSVVDGTSTTSPLRIFSITAFTSNKELVTKKIS